MTDTTRTRCWIVHDYGRYEPSREVTGSDGLPEVGQRRECRRCGAVDYRRVRIHN